MQQTIINVKEKCSVALDVVGEQLEIALHKTRVKSRLAYKYVNGKSRVKAFLGKRLDDFSAEHAVLFNLIENGDTSQNPELYQRCKRNIMSTLKAAKTLRTQKLVDPQITSEFMYEYLHTKRFGQRGSLTVK